MAVIAAVVLCVVGVLAVRFLASTHQREPSIASHPTITPTRRAGAIQLGAALFVLAGAAAFMAPSRVPPMLTVIPITGTHFTSSSAFIEVNVCSSSAVTASMTLNGSNVSPSFGSFENAQGLGCPQLGTTWDGSVSLNSGANTFSTSVCDAAGTCRTWTGMYYYDAPAAVPTRISLTPPSITLATNTASGMHATVYDQNGNAMSVATMNWTTSNGVVLGVQSSGPQDANLTGLNAGSATVTATTGTVSASAAVTVTSPTPVPTSISLNPPSANLLMGPTSLPMHATVLDQYGHAISVAAMNWSTSNGAVVTADVFAGTPQDATLWPHTAGTATITASTGLATVSAAITVTAPTPAAPTIDPPSPVTIPAGTSGVMRFRVGSGAQPQTVSLSATCGGLTSCGVVPTASIGAFSYVYVDVSFAASTSQAGAFVVRLTATGPGGSSTATGTVTVQAQGSIALVGNPSTSSTQVGTPGTATFRLTNNTTGTIIPAPPALTGCGGAIANCQIDPWTVPAAGAFADINVRYATLSQTSGLPLTLSVTAGSLSAQATVTVSVTPPAPPPPPGLTAITVVPVGPFPGGAVARDACLTISAGPGAAYECGVLRMVHELPSTRTYNKTRTPTLLYESDHGAPGTILAADVTVTGTPVPTSVDVTVKLGGKAVTKSFPWSAALSNGQPWRIAIPIDADLNTLTSATRPIVLLADTIEVKATGNGSVATDTKSGTVALVDRRNSAFGAGWWLDGLEQFISLPNGTQKLWIGGDGSTRVYTRQGTSDTWLVTPAIARAESLIYLPSSGLWHRLLPNGAYVEFDNTGVHQQTRDALGRFTTFIDTVIAGKQVLKSILLPAPNGTSPPTYSFAYMTDATGPHLRSVTSPYINGATRVDSFFRTASWITRIREADGHHVDFVYDGNAVSPVRRAIARLNRLGDTTFFSYDAAGLLHSSKLDMRRTGGASAPFTTQTFCPSESRSVAACSVQNPAADFLPQPRSAVYTLYDGPATGNADTTHLELTLYGAPSRIVSAVGGVTTIARTDTRWPLLVTEVTDPRGHIVRASYDSRAHVATTTDVNPDSAGATNHDATTTYHWDPTWDRVTSVVSPTGINSTATYDPATGDRLTESMGSVQRASYSYIARQVNTITTPLSATPTQIFYDGLGNLLRTVTPKGITTLTYHDGIGRDSVVRTPVDTAASRWRYAVVTYDIMDRAVAQVDSSGATTATDFQAARVENQYDAEGQTLSLIRKAIPDAAAVGSIETRYTYDEAGHRLTETDPYLAAGAQTARWVYDAAGNVLQHFDKQAVRNVSMKYDAMNRLVSRTLSSTVTRYSTVALKDTFEYDVVGNLLSGRNQFAEVGRRYTLAGRLAFDTLRIKAADLTTSGMSHVYVVVNGYDLEGRRSWQQQPANLAPYAGNLVQYAYDPSIGALSDVHDPAGNDFLTYYNNAGLPRALIMPGGITEVPTYDDDGRLYQRLEQGTGKTIHSESRVLDDRGKITSVSDAGDAQPVTGSYTFTGLGAALRVQTNGNAQETQRVTLDALANVLTETRQIVLDGAKRYTHAFAYQPHSTRIQSSTGTFFSFDEGSGAPVNGSDTLTHIYDVDGHLSHSSYTEGSSTVLSAGYTVTGASWYSDFIYNALGQLMGADHHTVNDNQDWTNPQYRPSGTALATGHGSYEEYRYDPLGRRIWTRSHRDTYCTARQKLATTDCLGFVTRTVWDGDQVLYEIRAPGGDAVVASDLERDDGGSNSGTYPPSLLGQVMYVHGAGIDRPLELVRSGSQYHVLHMSQRGLVDITTNPAGDYSTCGRSAIGVPCADVTWPGVEANYYYAPGVYPSGPRAWYGDMVRNFQDASGLQYRRNRYYDPSTGRFTQEDPIGIAGGINLYGFGGGDLVNYSDPFGLCGPLTPLCVWVLANLPEISIFGAEVATGLSVGGGRLTGSALRHAGKVGEAAVEAGLVRDGYMILGRQVSARTSAGRRVIDFLVQHPDGSMVAIEAKAGFAVRNASQLVKDARMAAEGAQLIGKNVPAVLRDATVVIPTEVRRP